jgi:hypothetical protein
MQPNEPTIRSEGEKFEITIVRAQLLELLRPVAREVARRLTFGNEDSDEREQNLRHQMDRTKTH